MGIIVFYHELESCICYNPQVILTLLIKVYQTNAMLISSEFLECEAFQNRM